MVRHDHQLVGIPYAGVVSEFAFKDADGRRPAHVVRHQDVDVDPDVLPGRDTLTSRMLRDDLLGDVHASGLIHATLPRYAIMMR